MATLSPTISPTNELDKAPRTSLRGVWLGLARALWFLVAGASLGMLVALVPLILRARDFGDWTIERSAQVFGINIFSKAFETYGLVLLGFKYLAVAVFVGVALYVFWRKTDDWMAILVSIMLLVLPHTFNVAGYTENWFVYHYPWDKLLYALDSLFNVIGNALLFLVFFLFPDGRFVPRWTRWVAFLPIVFVLAIWLGDQFRSFLGWEDTIPWLAIIMFFFGMLLLVTWSQIYRYRNFSTPAQRAQTRLVVMCLVSIVIVFLLLIPSALGLTDFMDSAFGGLVSFLLNNLTLTLLPLAFGVAMLRDQLWQSERVLNRAYVYAALSAILLLVYIVTVGTLSQVFRASNDFLIAAIATGVVALLFQPLRERLQRVINRFLYGERDEPFRVLNQLGAQLEKTLASDAALPLIVETIGKTLRVPYAAIQLNAEIAAAWGNPSNNLLRVPVRYQDQDVGELVIARRSPRENFSPADLQLIETLARQAGSVAYSARLQAELQHSRERIVTAREEERRRLRRDLHDGLGPTLAGQTLQLDAALDLISSADMTPSHIADAQRLLNELKAQTQATVGDIRRLVYELRPPALDELGLVGALRAHFDQARFASRGVRIKINAPESGLPLLSAAVEVAAYRIALEAVTNVVRHANATECAVQFDLADQEGKRMLRVQVQDNGRGLSPGETQGVGLSSMRERAEELGGTCQVESVPGQGTRVIATLPLG